MKTNDVIVVIVKTFIVIVLIATMTACSGGGGGSSESAGSAAAPDVSNNTVTTAGSSISGYVADGYLADARVFLDRNLNRAYDNGEPMAMTASDGSYTLALKRWGRRHVSDCC